MMLQSHYVTISLIPGAAPHVKKTIFSLKCCKKLFADPLMIADTQETSHETVVGSATSALTICQCINKTIQFFYNHLWLFSGGKKIKFLISPKPVFPVKSKTGALEGPEVDGFVKDMMGLVRVSSPRCETTVWGVRV